MNESEKKKKPSFMFFYVRPITSRKDPRLRTIMYII